MSAQARNIIMGMERYGKKEVKSTGSVNEMDIYLRERERKMTSKIFASLLVGWFSVTGNTRKGLNVEDWVVYYYFRYHLNLR